MGRKEFAVLVGAVSLTAAVCLSLPSRGELSTTQPTAAVGRYQLCSGSYHLSVKQDGKSNDGPIDGLFRLDTATGQVCLYVASIESAGDKFDENFGWKPVIERETHSTLPPKK